MLYELPGGGTIRVNEDRYFKLSDAEWEKYIMYVKGSTVNDPFHESALEDDISLFMDDDIIQAMKDDLPEIDLKGFMPEE